MPTCKIEIVFNTHTLYTISIKLCIFNSLLVLLIIVQMIVWILLYLYFTRK